MKQLLFLLLFPCLALAQYPNNGNQKITLGEQTTADGLVYRGIRADTASKIVPFSDTSAYIILDTVEKTLWLYKAGQVPKWQQVGGSAGGGGVTSFSAGTTGLTPSTATTGAVTLGGTLAVVNGGTNRTTMPAGYILHGDGTSIDTAVGLFWNRNNSRLGIGTNTPTSTLNLYNALSPPTINIANGVVPTSTSEGGVINLYLGGTGGVSGNYAVTNSILGKITFSGYGNNYFYQGGEINSIVSTGGNLDRSDHVVDLNFLTKGIGPNVPTERMRITGTGNVGIGTSSPAVQFHTTSDVRFAGLASITDLRTDADGDLFNGSDFNLKNSIDTINFGLSDVLKLKPVSFNWNDEARNINEYKSMGFIAQDVMDVIPNAASTMGDGDMQVDYNAIVATLTKAIQEQNALIKALEQRILTLENK